jgi:hypothetical protein
MRRISRHALEQVPAIRTGLVALGVLLILITPLVGIIPGPGGVFVFAASGPNASMSGCGGDFRSGRHGRTGRFAVRAQGAANICAKSAKHCSGPEND